MKGKRQRRRPRKNIVIKGLVNDPLSNFEAELVREVHTTLKAGKWVGVSTIGKEEDIISDIRKFLMGTVLMCVDLG
ncbi:hypothetical protein V6N13_088778 [Hibiscus sabdariffa]|uniref:Uncharacterized protein n=1 Tax=Hibiscus sabdariffa TaxID=183260 RepID=A0ABR2G0G6_9ROSI